MDRFTALIVSSVCRHGGARGQAGEGTGGPRRQAGGGRRGLGRAALRELQRRGHRERQRGGRLSFREVRSWAQTAASRHHQPPAARQTVAPRNSLQLRTLR